MTTNTLVSKLLCLERQYAALVEERNAVPAQGFWPSATLSALNLKANRISGDIMRTERRLLDTLKQEATK